MPHPEFDPIEFINKTYGEANLYEINDALAVLAKSISKTHQANKELISSHFSKFVQCRSMLEDIWKDMRAKGLDSPNTSRIERNISALSAKYREITHDIAADIVDQEYDSRRLFYRNELSEIFEMKEGLGRSVNSFERFVSIYKRAVRSSEKVRGSKFVQQKFEEVQPEIRAFLENVYRVISSEKISFEDACYHFDLYFSVSEDKSDRKIMSTLLVNFKETTTSKRENSSEYINYLLFSIRRLVKYVDDDIAVEGLKHFFECVRAVLGGTNALYARIVLKRIGEQNRGLEMSPACQREYSQLYSGAKLEIFEMLAEASEISGVARVYDEFVEVLSEKEKNSAQEHVLELAMKYVDGRHFENYEYLRSEVVEIKKLCACLGSRSSGLNRRLATFLKKHRGKVIESIAHTLSEAIETGDEVFILMEAVRIIDRTPEFCRDILFEAKNDIITKPIVHFYLSSYIRLEAPTLGSSERDRADDLKHQFGFLIK